MMARLFIATYLVDRAKARPAEPTPVAEAFLAARGLPGCGRFPFDAGDDPAFFSAGHLDGPVTWGVCRTDVRNQIDAKNDWVAFFSAEVVATQIEYRFVALLKVADRLSGHLLPMTFQQYLNRLIKKAPNSVWRHYEPLLPASGRHGDWLWRLSTGPYGRKDFFIKAGAMREVPDSYWTSRDADGKNYIVFDRQEGFILPTPPVIAKGVGNCMPERWGNSSAILELRRAIFGESAKRHLRTTNRHQPHRHTTRTIDGDSNRRITIAATELGKLVTPAHFTVAIPS